MKLQLFEWNDRFATGVEPIDQQHRSLLQITNELGDAIICGDAAAGERWLQRLRDYALRHFHDEEAWALSAGVPAAVLEAHHGRHEDFVAELGQFSDLWAQDGQHARTLHRFLSAWLITHILGEDRRMVLGISGLPGSAVKAPAALGARILSLANEWDKLLHGRKGERVLSEREAVAKVRECSGTLHDPAVVAALLTHLAGRRRRCGPGENPAQQRTGRWYGACTRSDRARRPADGDRHDPPHSGVRALRGRGEPAHSGAG